MLPQSSAQTKLPNPKLGSGSSYVLIDHMVELTGIELLTFSLRIWFGSFALVSAGQARAGSAAAALTAHDQPHRAADDSLNQHRDAAEAVSRLQGELQV